MNSSTRYLILPLFFTIEVGVILVPMSDSIVGKKNGYDIVRRYLNCMKKRTTTATALPDRPKMNSDALFIV